MARTRKVSTPRGAAGPAQSTARVRADKLSISLAADDVAWVTTRAKRLRTSVSAVIATAVADQRRSEARARLLAQLGSDDLSDEDVARARREAFDA